MIGIGRLRSLATRLVRMLVPPSWQSVERFDEEWKVRIAALAALLDGEKRVLDLGCGPMWLRQILPAGSEYLGCDYRSRGPGVIVCDFNQRQFPDVRADACFVSGCLEYVTDVAWFLRRARACAPHLVISYCTTELCPDFWHRRELGWVNHLSAAGLRDVAEEAGFQLEREAPPVAGNQLFRFVAAG